MPQHFGQTHHRQFAGIEPGLATGPTHRIATDTDEFGIRIAQPQLRNQPRAEDVARGLAGNQCEAGGRACAPGMGSGEWEIGRAVGSPSAGARSCTPVSIPDV